MQRAFYFHVFVSTRETLFMASLLLFEHLWYRVNQVENNSFLQRERKCKSHDGDEWCAHQKRVDTQVHRIGKMFYYTLDLHKTFIWWILKCFRIVLLYNKGKVA